MLSRTHSVRNASDVRSLQRPDYELGDLRDRICGVLSSCRVLASCRRVSIVHTFVTLVGVIRNRTLHTLISTL